MTYAKTLHEWATELAAGRGHSADEWEAAMVRAINRGTLGYILESTSPRVPRILDSEMNDWLTIRDGERELAEQPPLPENRAPRSFRQPANPGAGIHATRATIGLRNRW